MPAAGVCYERGNDVQGRADWDGAEGEWARAGVCGVNPRTELVAAADPDPSNLAIFLERFEVESYDDYHEMLRVEDLDIAAPILPVKPNPGVVIDCARAGVKAIYCEKPMAASLDEADRMVEETSARGIAFASGDAYRNMPQHWKVKALIDSGELGPVQSINLYQPTNEISGGGCQGLSVLRLFADDADVEWVTGWCADDPWSNDDQNMGGIHKVRQRHRGVRTHEALAEGRYRGGVRKGCLSHRLVRRAPVAGRVAWRRVRGGRHLL